MNCEQAKEAMADALVGQADRALEQHLEACASCSREFDGVRSPWRRMNAWQEAEPSPQARIRFHEMLDAYEHGIRERGTKSFWAWWPARPAVQFAIAAACLLAGFFGGRGVTPQTSSDVVELRKEVTGMRQLVTLSLLQQQSAAERLRGVTWAVQTESSDMEVLGALLRTVNTDPNVNVRLAAIDAVRNFAGSPVARTGLVQALPKQTSPMAQIALVEALVDLKQRDARPQILDILGTPDLDPTVRERLQAAAGKLQ